ncbi:hypothetical protein A2833_03355 [Candidatus Azambacteria bacterium RIFCSPHIGHO2_01_FULL_44_55]|nr:MAG: hypothetical protein A2833_03355 [Candidatus Azambacteria bacterium RIFCSPHIGHO2_01_FULL_44_55]
MGLIVFWGFGRDCKSEDSLTIVKAGRLVNEPSLKKLKIWLKSDDFSGFFACFTISIQVFSVVLSLP